MSEGKEKVKQGGLTKTKMKVRSSSPKETAPAVEKTKKEQDQKKEDKE